MLYLHSRRSSAPPLLPLMILLPTTHPSMVQLPQCSEQHHTGNEDHHSGETSRQRSPQVDHLEKSQPSEEPNQCCKTDMVKWNYTTGPDTCDCCEEQTMQHLLVCLHLLSPVTVDDLALANYTALQRAMLWKNSSRKDGHDEEDHPSRIQTTLVIS